MRLANLWVDKLVVFMVAHPGVGRMMPTAGVVSVFLMRRGSVLGILERHLLGAAMLRPHHNSSCELVMPALLLPVKRDPEKA